MQLVRLLYLLTGPDKGPLKRPFVQNLFPMNSLLAEWITGESQNVLSVQVPLGLISAHP